MRQKYVGCGRLALMIDVAVTLQVADDELMTALITGENVIIVVAAPLVVYVVEIVVYRVVVEVLVKVPVID